MTEHDPGDLDDLARRCAERMYADDVASRRLDIAIDAIASGRATVRMTVRDDMVNGHGTCHGGYVFLLADSAFAFACNTHDEVTVAAGVDIVFVAAAQRGDVLIADAVERTRYGRSGLCDVTIRRADGELIAEFRGRSRALGRRLLS